mmetsp:Transcript_20605/g.59076  ORF Transcript_20605/g.59076 Transcript_20605/m.59076 type:complete len:246 (-) Transcript_20605:158-895(-)
MSTPSSPGCCASCYATRCLVDCCVVSFCGPCRWCCDLPQTYEETYEWQLVPDGVNRLERRYETLTLEKRAAAVARTKEDRRRAVAERSRIRDANRRCGGDRVRRHRRDREEEGGVHHVQTDDDDDDDDSGVSSRGTARTRQSRQSHQSRDDHSDGDGDADADADWDHSVVPGGSVENTTALRRRRVANTTSTTSPTGPSLVDAHHDPITATRELRECGGAGAGDDAMPRDPILSERSEYESQLSC